MVISGNGQAEFITRYRAIMFKPFKGKVVDGVVHNVTRVRESSFFIVPLSFPFCLLFYQGRARS